MTKGSIFLLAIALCIGRPAIANVDDYPNSYQACIKQAGGNGDKINACTNTEISNQNSELNTKFNTLSAELSSYRRNLLQKNERAWIQFREAECDFQGSKLIGGPLGIEAQAQATFRSECILKQIYLRVRVLNDDLSAIREDGPK